MSTLQHALLHPLTTLYTLLQYLLTALLHPLTTFYTLLQHLLTTLFAPPPVRTPPPPPTGPRVAIIGAGITGISAAAHCVSHNSDVLIFDSAPTIGGIWARVNGTSSLQIHSIMYRFHPSITFQNAYPKRTEILEQLEALWRRYRLEEKTVLEMKVVSIERTETGKWRVNGIPEWEFDGVVAAVGTCGEPMLPMLPGVEGQWRFQGQMVHSSELEGVEMEGRKVVVLGGGASAVEALECALNRGAESVSLLSRSDKWIIPRNPLIDIILSLNPFGSELYISYIPEFLRRRLFLYRSLSPLAPHTTGLWESTPIVNSDLLSNIRSGRARWLRADILNIEEYGVRYSHRSPGVPKGGPGVEKFADADIIVFATGFKRPSLSFLPEDCFEEGYEPPNWYLQTFPPGAVDICACNCTYVNAIGTVGHLHVGVYTRLLLMFLNDPLTAPPAEAMRSWVKWTKWLKAKSPTGAFDFFTYGELCLWFLECVVVNPFRWKWAFFVFTGRGMPMGIVRKEREIIEGDSSRIIGNSELRECVSWSVLTVKSF
ncbi:FAD/NAD(P)-binding domain-containing protein [Morchella conica CCBAS932]|uniref:FAD/NAD(P)-binding domain-containing protein n=1 Tax=Morchella conica CCBAS932 TaxID=1392247 RepID=A0A3N4KQK9_9PEZI|nr:FAD/NAD(P)-binding domain-containing protein [Morchella conica CCBAS932]